MSADSGRRTTVEVYLVSRVEWSRGLGGSFVGPAPRFKVGYSADPFERLEQLKAASGHNLALWGVVLCGSVDAAARVERRCHDLLREHRRRGEWFEASVDEAWETISREFPDASLRLTTHYDVDLDTMRLVPPRPGAWSGVADGWHHYRAFKEHGLLEGPFAALGRASRPAEAA